MPLSTTPLAMPAPGKMDQRITIKRPPDAALLAADTYGEAADDDVFVCRVWASAEPFPAPRPTPETLIADAMMQERRWLVKIRWRPDIIGPAGKDYKLRAYLDSGVRLNVEKVTPIGPSRRPDGFLLICLEKTGASSP